MRPPQATGFSHGEVQIDGVILCGGQGKRMGGKQKGLFLLKGKPLFVYAAEKLAPRVKTLWISANRFLDEYAKYGWPVIKDCVENLGPLGGIYSVLLNIQSSLLLVLPCDCPFFEIGWERVLLEKLLSSSASVAYISDGQKEQFLFALFKKSALSQLEEYLLSGQRQVEGFYRKVAALKVDWADASQRFFNINTLEAFEEANKMFDWIDKS
ncbi:molybdenum cofactor guanylyltransferase [Methylacidiphilum sp. Yel]|nr:molybdenum cofactor guanylyltransferase [Methylacidiphilum sp. Yel]